MSETWFPSASELRKITSAAKNTTMDAHAIARMFNAPYPQIKDIVDSERRGR